MHVYSVATGTMLGKLARPVSIFCVGAPWVYTPCEQFTSCLIELTAVTVLRHIATEAYVNELQAGILTQAAAAVKFRRRADVQ